MAEPPSAWRDLRRFTAARVGLGRSGNGLPTRVHLAFQAAHALARDAVHAPLDTDALARDLAGLGLAVSSVRSRAPDRATYLLRPDLGRAGNADDLAALPREGGTALMVGDGLSATAVQRHAVPLLASALPLLGEAAPRRAVIATGARVALGDALGEVLGAELVIVLIGERPGLSAPDSLGAYITWAPRPGRTDAERNCISNIRPGGLGFAEAAATLAWLVAEMRRRRLSGVALKDERPAAPSLPG
ncbi:ethanolamine ammonia-lyase subunit EutC [Elioraea rosea]|uniref:ethanolamine ammonia-lyase subunit EutC n=1 Tax=Elioraea rosea TaxID=2492390 RepID=UPI001182B62B|nr:ethanolamine ammonia-lyase subunit EutC [Elioraea rosea]